MDKYDYLEIAYRFALFCVICIASGYILMTEWAARIVGTGTGFIQYIGVFIGVVIWIIFNVGVGAYLIFVAKGSFRPKTPDEDNDEDEDDLELDTEELADKIKENSNE